MYTGICGCVIIFVIEFRCRPFYMRGTKKWENGVEYDVEFSLSYAVTHTGAVYNLTQIEHNDPAKIDSS